MSYRKISNTRILVTGGAGFIGSNLCDDLLKTNNEVICLDNFSTGRMENIQSFCENKNFTLIKGDIRNLNDCNIAACCKTICISCIAILQSLIKGDIRNLNDCNIAMQDIQIVLQQAALGSVPRSLKDPITTNEVNIGGFLNVLVAARDAKVKRVVYAASSSTYGDSESLPKIEEIIGKPLSPYAVTKYVNELYAHVFGLNYGLDCIGLRYFNVYGRRQDPNGAYAAAIPKFTLQLMAHQSPVI